MTTHVRGVTALSIVYRMTPLDALSHRYILLYCYVDETYLKREICGMQTVAKLMKALAGETRLRILEVLTEDEATVSDLAGRLSLAQPRISSHLKVLSDAGLVTVAALGRQRTYCVDADRISRVLTALQALVPPESSASEPSPQAACEVRHNTPIRQARTCYDHLAGVAGITLLDEMVRRRWLVLGQRGDRPQYNLTPEGGHALTERGIDLDGVRTARRLFAYGCLDWTERRHHLGGALGAAALRALARAGAIRRNNASRAVTLLKPIRDWLDKPASIGNS
jgi:DNA-binding transcriptional ArsR family regulator